MQAVAGELNLSETAFLHPEPAADAPDAYRLRWFTPTVEVDLCGHATLAAAHVLWEDGHLGTDRPATFATNSGRLAARREGEAIALDFPSEPAEPCPPPPGLAEAIGAEPVAVGRNRFDLLAELADAGALRSLRPDFRRLAGLDVRGLIVTCRGDGEAGADFLSRFFAPAAGVDEDPVTGSAHCALGPYWASRLGRDELRRPAGLAAGRHRRGPGPGRPGRADRPGGHGDPGRDRLSRPQPTGGAGRSPEPAGSIGGGVGAGVDGSSRSIGSPSTTAR